VKHLFTLISQNSFHEKTIKLIEEREKTLRELRKENIPTVPFFLFEELTTNPFLWCDEPEFIDSFSKEKKDPSSIFSRLREMKNDFH
jgi:hydroxyacylglutathione hydrolase